MEELNNNVDKAREQLRELQSMLFSETLEPREIFQKTLIIDDLLNEASIDFNKYLIDKNKN